MTEMSHYTGTSWLDWSTRVYRILHNQSMPSLLIGVDCLGSWLVYRMLSVIVIPVITVTTGVYLMVLDTFHLTFTKLMTLQKGISFSAFQMESGQCPDKWQQTRPAIMIHIWFFIALGRLRQKGWVQGQIVLHSEFPGQSGLQRKILSPN